MTFDMKALLDSLTEDAWRNENPFSEEVAQANRVLLYPFASDSEKKQALAAWLQRHQSCRFGRIAAAIGQMHFCILTHDDIRESDEHIAEKIRLERLIWKQRAIEAETESKHGFMLLVASERVLCAAPDSNLKAFSARLRSLWDLTVSDASEGNDVSSDFLYLKNPTSGDFYGFHMNIDYFAAAGDGRWWHDHRIPGGIAFTANSLGHMLRHREWYENKTAQVDWGVKTSMLTIDAAERELCAPAKWLIPHREQSPSKCPFANQNALPRTLQGKDWNSYEGTLHTDHSIREEFFDGNLHPARAGEPWQMDFSYIFDDNEPDFKRMSSGSIISADEVYQEIGRPDTWRLAEPGEAMGMIVRTPEQTREVRTSLNACNNWKLTQNELQELDLAL